MYKESQKLVLKPEHLTADLPKEVSITAINGEAITINSAEGTFESSAAILDAFYTAGEEFTLETMPKLTVEALDELVALFDAYGATQSALLGIQIKTKLLNLKDSVAKVTGLKLTAQSLLGRKIS